MQWRVSCLNFNAEIALFTPESLWLRGRASERGILSLRFHSSWQIRIFFFLQSHVRDKTKNIILYFGNLFAKRAKICGVWARLVGISLLCYQYRTHFLNRARDRFLHLHFDKNVHWVSKSRSNPIKLLITMVSNILKGSQRLLLSSQQNPCRLSI